MLTMQTTRSIILLIILSLLWGIGYPIMRYVMMYGMHPVTYAFWQAAGPAVLLMLFLIYKKTS